MWVTLRRGTVQAGAGPKIAITIHLLLLQMRVAGSAEKDAAGVLRCWGATLKVLMSYELSKAYDPSVIEERWAEYWVRERLFDVASPSADTEGTQGAAKKFTQLLPPPNVTGRLHMGHMLNQTEMDILTRWHRMLGHGCG